MTTDDNDTPRPLALGPIEGEGIAGDASAGASFLPTDKDVFWQGFVQAFNAANILAAMRYGRPLAALDVANNPTARPASDALCEISGEQTWLTEWLAALGPWIPRAMALGMFGLSTRMAFGAEVEAIERERAAAHAAANDGEATTAADGA